jgi:hypothetical protein
VSLPPGFSPPDGIETATDLFVGYLLLDAWIGNGDRHHENWGFIRCGSGQDEVLYLSPTYDHASCLGRELLDEKRQVKSVEAYAQKSLSAFYWAEADKKPLTTFDLFSVVANQYPVASGVWLGYLELISPQQMNSILGRFPKTRLSEMSAKFAKDILNFNQNRLLALKK